MSMTEIPEALYKYENILNNNLNKIGLNSHIEHNRKATPKIMGHYLVIPFFELNILKNKISLKKSIGEIKAGHNLNLIQEVALYGKISSLNLIAYNSNIKDKLNRIRKNLESELNVPVNINLENKPYHNYFIVKLN